MNFAFEAIKKLVVSRECLTVIDHEKPGDNKIFVTTDASDWRTGVVLSFGPTWETARPVAFDSMQLKGAELNYPVHEKELLAIIRALKKWRMDLMGSEFVVYTRIIGRWKTLTYNVICLGASCVGRNSCPSTSAQLVT